MSVRGSIFISFGQAGGQFALQFASNIVLARLLLPSEIGVFSVTVAVTAILHALRDFGVSRYLIKEANLTDDKVRTVFGVAILIGWGLAALIFFGRGAVANFYASPQIEGILTLLSINFLMLPFGQPALVLMRRELRYGRLMAISLATGFVGASTSIIFAALGFGPFALAYGALANTGLMVVISLLSRPGHILLLPSLKEWRSVCGFGGVASLGTIVMQVGMQAPELLLGRFLGFSAVGLFSRGLGLAKIFEQLFVSAISWVTGAELGARHRSGKGLTDLVLKVTDYTLLVVWPTLIFLALKAESVIWLLYGDNWLPAVPLVQALCLARGLHLIVSQAPAVYEGTGSVGLQLRNEIILQVISIGLLLVGVQYSLEAVAWLRVPLGAAVILVHFSVLRRYADIDIRQMFFAIWRSGVVAMSFGMLLIVLIILEPAEMVHNPLILFSEAGIMGLIYIILIYLVSHPFCGEIRNLLGSFFRPHFCK
jgi:O-antigen/teichoic acid export membrane protein